jgi:hypothetical protein
MAGVNTKYDTHHTKTQLCCLPSQFRNYERFSNGNVAENKGEIFLKDDRSADGRTLHLLVIARASQDPFHFSFRVVSRSRDYSFCVETRLEKANCVSDGRL